MGAPAAVNTLPPAPATPGTQSPTPATGVFACRSPSIRKPPEGIVTAAVPCDTACAEIFKWPAYKNKSRKKKLIFDCVFLLRHSKGCNCLNNCFMKFNLKA